MVPSSTLLRLAQSKWGLGHPTGNGVEYVFTCPSCGKKKLYFNIRTGFYLCFRCFPSVKGRLDKRYQGYPEVKFGTYSKREGKSKGWKLDFDWNVIEYPPKSAIEWVCLEYLLSRGLNLSLIRAFNLGWCSNLLAVSIPVGDHYVLRLLYDAKTKYLFEPGFNKSKLLFNFERVASTPREKVFVFEGIFDVICAAPFDSVAVLGSFLSMTQCQLLSKLRCRELIFCFDPDVAREKVCFCAAMSTLYFDGQIKIGKLPRGKDPGDLGQSFEQTLVIKNWWEV